MVVIITKNVTNKINKFHNFNNNIYKTQINTKFKPKYTLHLKESRDVTKKSM